ncbi:MAG TPA: response regulator transcription factor [Firmicutes bacterium]|nr:response regulator transcription factor [Bacillota bacterium]
MDDHALVREGTRELLEQESDIKVVGEAADGEEAVRLAASLLPKVVTMDVSMPGMNGIEATAKIKQACPGVAVLALTAYDDDPYVFALLDAGVAGYLLKSASGSELVSAIRAVARGETVLDKVITAKVVKRALNRGASREEPQVRLSTREVQVLRLVASGLGNKEIASQLGISARTVQVHLYNIFSKLDVDSRTEAVIKAAQKGWIDIGGGPERKEK